MIGPDRGTKSDPMSQDNIQNDGTLVPHKSVISRGQCFSIGKKVMNYMVFFHCETNVLKITTQLQGFILSLKRNSNLEPASDFLKGKLPWDRGW